MANEMVIPVQVNLAYLGTKLLREFAQENITPVPLLTDIQPASIDLHLHNHFVDFGNLMHRRGVWGQIDPRKDNSDLGIDRVRSEFIIPPHGFALGATVEKVSMPHNLLGRVEGKSSLGRLGLQVHVTAGFIDPGFEGQITLEFHNILSVPWMLVAGMPICQLSVASVEGAYGYRGKYTDGGAPRQSLYHMNWNGVNWNGR